MKMFEGDELKKVFMLYIGGKIGMKKNDHGEFELRAGVFLDKVKSCLELHNPELAKKYWLEDNILITSASQYDNPITYHIQEYEPLIYSNNMTPNDWISIAKIIEENYSKFDGFVLVQGTDTMAYTASVLSFMFKNLTKPVILTGAQISIFDSSSDAKLNLLHSLLFAVMDIPEVCVCFSNKLMRGNRVRHINSMQADAFDSPNCPYLGKMGVEMKIFYDVILPKPQPDWFSVRIKLCTQIGIIYMFPTITRIQLLTMLETTLEGAVLVNYGVGNINSDRKDLLDILQNAIDRGLTLINVTQCNKGTVMLLYETGREMKEMGIISGKDMTIEAAYAKLMVICGLERDATRRAEMMEQNICGEWTKILECY